MAEIRNLTHKELIEKIAKKIKVQPTSVEKTLEAFIDVVAEELRLTGQCSIQNFGKIITKPFGGFFGASGAYIKERNVPKMKFSNNFKDLVNGFIVTRANKYKLKEGKNPSAEKKIRQLKRQRDPLKVDELLKTMAKTGQSVESQLIEEEELKKRTKAKE